MPFGDSQNYVGQDGAGWHAFVGGREVGGGPFPTQAQAEQAYNANGGPPPTGGGAAPPVAPVVPGGISSAHREDLRVAGYGDWANPALTEADYSRIAAGASGAAPTGTNGVPGMESFNPAVWTQVQAAIQQAYNQELLKQGDRQAAVNAAIAEADNQLKALGLVAGLRGPENAFQEQSVISGLNAQGYSKAFDQLAGIGARPTWQADQAAPRPVTLQSIANDVRSAGPNAGLMSPLDQAVGQLFAGLGWTTGGGTTPTTPAAAGTYQTKNGPRTVDQMLAELKTAQWGPAQSGTRPSDADILAKYGDITGQPVAGGPAPTTAAPATTPPAAAPAPAPAPATTPPVAPGPVGPTDSGAGPRYPIFDAGGVVPGAPGSHELAVVQAGETVTPPPVFGDSGVAGSVAPAPTAPAASTPTGPASPAPSAPAAAAPATPRFGAPPVAGPPPLTAVPAAPKAPAPTGPVDSGIGGGITAAPHGNTNDPGTGGTALPKAPVVTIYDDMVNKMGPPSNIDVRNWDSMDPDTQNFLLSAYEKKGYSKAYVLDVIAQLHPKFAAPKFGSVAA